MSNVQLKCPACGAPINFDVPSGKMKCDYCGATFSVAEVNQFNGISTANQELKAAYQKQSGADSATTETDTTVQSAQSSSDSDKGQPGWIEPPATYLDEVTGQQTAQFQCDSCGGEIICSPDTVSTKCPWCNNNFVATGQLVRTRVPDRMIPFGITKEQALAAFKQQTSRLKLLPKAFKNVRIDDIQGVYIPYWLYDATVSGQAVFSCEKTSHWSDSEYRYTEHSVYDVTRSANVAYLDVPVSGTSKVDRALTEAIEPFDYSTSVDFSPAYLTGFLTNKYDVEAKTANPRALERMQDSTADFLRDSVIGYDRVEVCDFSVQPAFGELEYVFLPLWLLNVNFQGKNYNYAMNGQTGKLVGTFPVSKAKYWLGLLSITGISTVIFGIALIRYVMPWFAS